MNRRQRREAAQRAGANGGQQPQQQVQVPITKQVLFSHVIVDVVALPEGGRQLQIVDPAAGTIYLVPFAPEPAKAIGQKLLSPSIEVAGADQMPEAPPQ